MQTKDFDYNLTEELDAPDPLEYHKRLKGKIEVISRAKIETREDLSVAYTPGVSLPCLEIANDISKVYDYTRKHNMVAVITDGSSVLGMGDIGPEASLPVMEGKCVLFKTFADVDAFPIAIKTQDVDEFVRTVELISPMFGGINLEDISAPRCFQIEKKLIEKLDIPIFHDDQHGTSVVILAGLYNSLKIVGKKIDEVKIVMNGVGAAGVATTKLLLEAGAKNISLVDSKGLVCSLRNDLNFAKLELLEEDSIKNECGSLSQVMVGADVFIGVSRPNIVTQEMIRTMNNDAIVFAMSNPIPEISRYEAKESGARIVTTGRSDYPNQINNVIAFPGIMRGLLDLRTQITSKMKLRVARALADHIKNPTDEEIIPHVLDKDVAGIVAMAIKDEYENR
ncbi:NADP-dependent malic enzyme [Patescibacteria group bacterium]|nr:NADP-dependent malic enzyme [Patescibacteria group bacterium]MBU1895666.1 NADP-dependent malic enzyme [Patescibacteria group bacterium]